ncbi:hypothetical protein PLICRDRAFT_313940 [Plicaturopsis crispa FD-325 SS-3]|nr:hypothetical protein PLICRDRAFT_313940 [Plicaturopsis crispa FD-325 SS-3]
MSHSDAPPPPPPSCNADKTAEINMMVDKYSQAFMPHHPTMRSTPHAETVLLTGSTGTLGTYILELLLKDSTVKRIYALNRREPGGLSVRTRQKQAFRQRGLDSALAGSAKVLYVEGDAASLSPQLRHQVSQEVTCIIHNVWPVRFTASLVSLEPMIRKTRALVDLALESPHSSPPRFVFVSSDSIYHSWSDALLASEVPLRDPAHSMGTGYYESKWVAEAVLWKASRQTTLRPTVARVGQLCGGAEGVWIPSEWPALIFILSQASGFLPRLRGEVAWITAPIAAAAIVELRMTDKPVVHIVHPSPTQWSSIIDHFALVLDLPIFSWDEWLAALESPAHPQALLASQFLKIARIFGHVLPARGGEVITYPPLSQESTVEESPSLRAAPAIGLRDVEAWVTFWQRLGLMPGMAPTARL